MFVGLRLDARQAELLRQVKEAKAIKTNSAAIALCIVEAHSLFFGKENTYRCNTEQTEVRNEQAEA